MSQISVQNLTFGYDGGYTNVFENVSFCIDTEWKLGLVGRNGRGKTTFLNLLLGKLQYTGKISSSVKFSYFPYAVKDVNRLSCDIVSDICHNAEDWEIIRELSYLNVDAEALYRPFSTLSNGERTKILLAGLFLNEGDFLLIDEPTNHLDTEARQIVAEYLKRKKGFILVSHDRGFLDGCVDHILSINRADIEVQSGNFSSWFENFQRWQAFEAAQNEKLKKDISRLSEAAKRTAEWSDKTEEFKFGKTSSGLKPDRGYVGHKAAKIMKRAKSAEARSQQAIEQKSALLKNAETYEKLKLFPLEYRSEKLVSFNKVQILYGGNAVCDGLTFDILKGERIVLQGKNGCGKSSVLKMLAGKDICFCGTLYKSSDIKISYLPQTTEGVKGNLRDFAIENGIDESLFKAVLNKMDFGKKDFDADISSFSEGQKKKTLIAKSLCQSAHLYIWDEPLNYIDIYSRIQIENLIKEFKPTMIFAEHDKAFQLSVATKFISM